MKRWDEYLGIVIAYYPGDGCYVVRDGDCLKVVKPCAFGTC